MSRTNAGVTLATCLALLPALGGANSPRELIQQGNEHYAAGRYTEALGAYQQAADAAKTAGVEISAELLHNQAAAEFKLGHLDEARELWVRALARKDAAFEAAARYNLGNCHYAEALKPLKSPDLQQPVSLDRVSEPLDRAIEQYRDALRLDPALQDARANLELAFQLKKKLEEQATSQPQSQPSSQKGDKKQKHDQSSQPSQDQQGGENQSGDQNQQNESSSTQPSTQPSTAPATQPDSQKQDREQPPPPSTQPDESETQEPPKTPSSQPADQPPPESKEQATPPEQQGEPPPTDQRHGLIRMTREQAERWLQRIRDAEKLRRRALLERERARQKPVDRDW
jgi:Ca-activated chloride channel family protein